MLDIILSIGILVLITICFYISLKSNKKNKISYDEMQKNIRNKAYKNSFFMLIAYNFIVSLLEKFGYIFFDSFMTTSFVGILISLFTFAFICVKNDSYLGISENYKQKISLLIIIGIINLISFIVSIINGLLFTNHLITFKFCYGLIAFIFISLGILLIVKRKINYEEE